MRTLTGVCVALVLGTQSAQAQTPFDTSAQLQRLAATVTHFGTGYIVTNRMPRFPTPDDLVDEHQRVLDALRQASSEPDALRTLLDHPDPAVRTLALGGLFIREDPRDLPLIARLLGDSAPTTLLLKDTDRAGGSVPRSDFEARQTVGDVARAMVESYFEAAGLYPRNPAELIPLFETYWAERQDRARTSSWVWVRMRRATRQTSPLQPQYRADIDRVLAEIDALPSTERAWTLFFVRTAFSNPAELVAETVMVEALRAAGGDAVLRFLAGVAPIDDPDLKRAAAGSIGMMTFLLNQAPHLLSSQDADHVLSGAERFRNISGPEAWIAASARLRALDNPQRGGDDLKNAIASTPPNRVSPTIQVRLTVALWQVRGAAERDFIADWVYEAVTRPLGGDAIRDFFMRVEQEARPDTGELVAAVVADARFDRASWYLIAPLLRVANRGLSEPLVTPYAIQRGQPGSSDLAQEVVLAHWRTLLRQHVTLRR